MLRERIATTMLLAALGLAAFAAVRPASPDPNEDLRSRETRFFINKAHQQHRFDGVVVGDSRALRAVSPAAVGEALGGARVFNFAFNAGGMNDEMYAAAEQLLDPSAEQPFILLAPTSLSFQEWKRNNSQYREFLAKPFDQVWFYLNAGDVAELMQPVSPSVYVRKALDIRPPVRITETFHADGWIASDQVPPDDYRDLDDQRVLLAGHQADPELIAGLMAQTRRWSARDVQVYAFFPPAYPPRVALEDSMLGFDRAAFIAEFEAAGGTWLDVPQTGFTTYDGSHLVAGDAAEFSRILGTLLAHAVAER